MTKSSPEAAAPLRDAVTQGAIAEASRPDIADRLRMQTWALFIIAFASLVVVLSAGRLILMSLVLGVMVFSVTVSIIDRIARLHVWGTHFPRWAASVVAILIITGGLIVASIVVVAQVNQLVFSMIDHSEEAQIAIARAFSWMSDTAAREVLAALRSININSYLRSIAFQVSNLFSVAVMTSMFAGFLFVEQFYFRSKLRALYPDIAGAERAAAVSRSVARRINRYLLVKTLVSAAVGIIVYALMRLLGLQFAGPVAMLSFVLNYIPNLGTFLASGIAILAAFIQMPDWGVMVTFSALIVVIQFLSGNIIEPVLMGRNLAVSTLGIIVSLAFWGLVWGVMGMFLAVPINVALMVIFSHIRPLRPIAVLLSRDGQIDETDVPAPAGA